jgi:asparagine synthase (glutamine-hydrolysing)
MAWGKNCVHRFIGMFAFVVYDINRGKVLLFRDRAGVKPLYYYHHGGVLLFASELKSFHRHPAFRNDINTDAAADFLKHGWIPGPHSIYQHTYKLLPGHVLELNIANKEITTESYWDILRYTDSIIPENENELIEEIHELMKSAFNYRMVADVPVGVFLSGGYDSSLVTAILQKSSNKQIKTFSIGFEEEAFNEAPFAKKVAAHLGTDHHEFYCTYQDAINLIPALPDYYDEPFADSSALPTTLVSQHAVKQVKVALSADGGDELFCGYPRYYSDLDHYTRFTKMSGPQAFMMKKASALAGHLMPNTPNGFAWRQKLLKVEKILSEKNWTSKFRYRIEPYHFKENELKKILCFDFEPLPSAYDDFKQLKHQDVLNLMMAIEYKTTLVDDLLVKVDRASMSCSLECREPFLDHRLTEYMTKLSSSVKFKNNTPKYLIKKIAHQYIPKEMMNRPKMGFGIPTDKWLKAELKPMVCDLLIDSNIPLFNKKALNTYINQFYSGVEPNAEKIWFLLTLALWYNKWEKKTSL